MAVGSLERYATIVRQTERFARTRLGEPLYITELCTHLKISQRILRSAFHAIHHQSPYRYLRKIRLLEARRVLLMTRARDATVTSIARDHGFVELGRFAVEYRALFGESPSSTLNRRRSSGSAETECCA